MGWLSDLINKTKKKATEAVQGTVQNVTSGVQNAAQNVVQQAVPVAQTTAQNVVQQGQQAVQNVAQNVVQQGQQYVQGVMQEGQQAVQNAAHQGQQYVQGAVQQATPVVQGAVQQGQQVAGQVADNVQNKVQGAAQVVQNAAQGVQNAVQNTAQGVTDKVNAVNDKIQGNTPAVAPAVTPTQTTAPTQTQTQTQTPTQPEAQAPASSFDADAPIMTYEDYLKQSEQGLGYIKDKATQQIDQQNTETLKHIDEALATGNKHAEDVKSTTDAAIEAQKQADIAYAESQRDLTLNASRAEKDEVYKYAEETLASSLGYNEQAYGSLVNAITEQMEAGKLAASEAKDLLMKIAEEAKNTTYGAAERQREEAERQADINRQRAIADANSAYEQNKAIYGAKAEALGNMGLTAGGYGDWLNASAYAQNRGEVQSARAQSDTAKREAKYTEDMTKLQADQEYSDKKFKAESEYQNKLYDIDTTYRTNLTEAEQSKLEADKKAQDAERDAKREADKAHNENVYKAENTYGEWLNKAESAERADKLKNETTYKEALFENEKNAADKKLEVSQSAENEKLKAEISYVEGILGNSKALAEYKESLKAGDAAAEEKKLAVYEQLLKGVNDGTYTAEDAAALADAFGLGTEWKNAIANSAESKAEADASATKDSDTEYKRGVYTELLDIANRGGYTADQIASLADEYGLTAEQKQSLISAAEGYAGKVSEAEGKAESEATRDTYTKLLGSANSGAYTAEQIGRLADEYGLTAEQKASLVSAANEYKSQYDDAVNSDTETQQKKTYVDLLSGVYSGAYDKDLVADLADEFGLSDKQKQSLIDAAGRYADDIAAGKSETDTEYKRGVYTELLDIANRGGYTEEQIASLADEYGLSDKQKQSLIGAAQGYTDRVGDEKAQIEAETKLNVYTSLLDAANMGGYTAEQIVNLATRYGLDETQTEELRAAAEAYATEYSDAVAKDEAAQKNMQFINLLGSANLGELTKDELENVATALGLDDAQKSLLAKAAERYTSASEEDKAAQKSMNFVSLLDGANTGAYTAAQIEEIAKQFGFDTAEDKALINMLKTAANDFAAGEAGKTAKEDKQYQNGIYAELLAAANNGDYTAEQAKDLAARFGLDTKAQNLVGDAARIAVEKKEMKENDLIKGESAQNKLAIKGYVTGDTTDEELDEYVGDDLLTQEDADSLKEYRNKQAKTEISDMIKGGNYQGAVARAEELMEMRHIDKDTYQNAYFEAKKNSAATEVKTADDVADYTADLENMLNSGKISQKDYNSLLAYMYKNVGGKLSEGSYSVKLLDIGAVEVDIAGELYKRITMNGIADETVSNILTNINGGKPDSNVLVMFDDQLYYGTGDGKWIELRNLSGLYDAYNKQIERQAKPNDPKHQAGSSTNGGYVNPGAAAHGR